MANKKNKTTKSQFLLLMGYKTIKEPSKNKYKAQLPNISVYIFDNVRIISYIVRIKKRKQL